MLCVLEFSYGNAVHVESAAGVYYYLLLIILSSYIIYHIYYLHLQDAFGIPENGVGVEMLGWIEPKEELLLSIAFALGEYVCVDGVGIATRVSKELEIYLVVLLAFR